MSTSDRARYFVSDKNIYDALNLNRVDRKTIQKLFRKRNTIISHETSREEQAEYFSRLIHDFQDHKDIAAKLGIVARRERLASVDLSGIDDIDVLANAAESVKKQLEEFGDSVKVSQDGASARISIEYTLTDFRKNEFQQTQRRDGSIELELEDGYVRVRYTDNDYIRSAVGSIVESAEKENDIEIEKREISLFSISEANIRSQFFYDLSNGLDGFNRQDVTDVYIYKPPPEIDKGDEPPETYIEKVAAAGSGVSSSAFLNKLLDEEAYHVVRFVWLAKATDAEGAVFEIEARFNEPKDCTSFAHYLKGVFVAEPGEEILRRRAPTQIEIRRISRVVESRARELIDAIESMYSLPERQDGD